MNLKTLAGTSALAASILAARADIVIPVANNDFESQTAGAADAWSVDNTPVTDISGNGVGGSYGETFGPGSSKISQDVTLIGSSKDPVTYQITFWAMNLITDAATFNPNGGQGFNVKLDGEATAMISVAAGTTIGAYTEYVVDVTSKDSGAKELDFTWTGNQDTKTMSQGEGLLDNVSVTAVPEPSTLLAGIGMLLPFGIGLFRSVRRKSQAQ